MRITKESSVGIQEKCLFWKKQHFTRAIQMDEDFVVETSEGIMKAEKGDFLVWDDDNNPFPINQQIFKKIYMPDEQICNECIKNDKIFFSHKQEDWTIHHISTGH